MPKWTQTLFLSLFMLLANGEQFAMVDAAFAPFFMRLGFLESWSAMGLLDGKPKTRAWSELLLARPAVQNSVVPELKELYRKHIGASAGYGASVFAAD